MKSKICSWDVGIKNLAYCIIHKTCNKYEMKRVLFNHIFSHNPNVISSI